MHDMRLASWSGVAMLIPLGMACIAQGQTAIAKADAGCNAQGDRIVARRWDAVLGRGWATVLSCAHPEWPARSVAFDAKREPLTFKAVTAESPKGAPGPLLIHPGDTVRLWSQAQMVRIEMSGVAEQAARAGDRVVVRVTRQTDDAGLIVERIDGVARGVGDVEMGG